MTSSKNVLFLLALVVPQLFGTGCDRSDKKMARQERTETVPKELLDPKFLESLSVCLSNSYDDRTQGSQRLRFPADSPEAKLARKLLLSVLLDQEAEQLPLSQGDPLPVRFSYFNKSSTDPDIEINAVPLVDEQIAVYIWQKPNGIARMVKHLVCNQKIVDEINEVWEKCSRGAQQQDGNGR